MGTQAMVDSFRDGIGGIWSGRGRGAVPPGNQLRLRAGHLAAVSHRTAQEERDREGHQQPREEQRQQDHKAM